MILVRDSLETFITFLKSQLKVDLIENPRFEEYRFMLRGVFFRIIDSADEGGSNYLEVKASDKEVMSFLEETWKTYLILSSSDKYSNKETDIFYLFSQGCFTFSKHGNMVSIAAIDTDQALLLFEWLESLGGLMRESSGTKGADHGVLNQEH